MIFKLIVFKDNWADEIDCEGFAFLRTDEWDKIQKEIKLCVFPIEVYFGSNEFFTYDDADEFLSKFKVTAQPTFDEISDIKKMFGMSESESHFGICPYEACEGDAPDEYYDEEGNFTG